MDHSRFKVFRWDHSQGHLHVAPLVKKVVIGQLLGWTMAWRAVQHLHQAMNDVAVDIVSFTSSDAESDMATSTFKCTLQNTLGGLDEGHECNAGDAEAGSSTVGALGSGSTREAKLTKLVETLKGRLESLRGENAQLEELLLAADNRASGTVLSPLPAQDPTCQP